MEGLIDLINHLHRTIPSLKHIAGHEDLDTSMMPASNDDKQQVRRKIDPGPLFPWQYIMNNIQLINIGSTAKKYE
jgi:N-acetylmuramoyl-L-alanine amidase